jgi:tRNA(fMet)-specific endonuclease VapC
VADPQFMLDTNICIYVLEGLLPKLRDKIQSCAPEQLVTSAITYAEVIRGIDPDDRIAMAKIARFFKVIPAVPFDAPAAFAFQRVPFRRKSFDRLIAAHALALGLTVVTNNEADFADVPGLKVENWTV